MPFILRSKISEGTLLGVWQITETEETLLPALALTPEDRARLGDIRNEVRRLQWLACRVALRQLVPDPKARVEYSEAGQPLLVPATSGISFSHTGDLAAVLVSEGRRPGIDIELLRDRIHRVAERFMSEEESARTSPPCLLEKRYIHWAAKEAVYKLYGGGLDIQNEIILNPFDYLCTGIGTVRATVRTESAVREHPLHYLVTGGWVLAYGLDPPTE